VKEISIFLPVEESCELFVVLYIERYLTEQSLLHTKMCYVFSVEGTGNHYQCYTDLIFIFCVKTFFYTHSTHLRKWQ